jgi:adenylosuccinate synthase
MYTFHQPSKASFIVGGQWGSEGKGAAAAWTAYFLQTIGRRFDIVTTNAGAQAGHTSVHNGRKRVVYHLPTAALISRSPVVYLNAGSVIDVDVLLHEMSEHSDMLHDVFIHPNAAIITEECKVAEQDPNSQQTQIASTRKGVGQAVARKALRSGLVAKQVPELRKFIRRLDLGDRLAAGLAVLVEVPQGIGLSLNGKFYPHCTSRDCTVMQAASDAGIPPRFVGPIMLVLRTFPIRVGNIGDNSSGGCYHDQQELTWEAIGVEPEITTVTKRVRRVFSWSQAQVLEAMSMTWPDIVFLSFCDYAEKSKYDINAFFEANIRRAASALRMPHPQVIRAYGPSTDDVKMGR